MGNPYTRQSVASIVNGQTITAAPLNAEFNALKDAFDSAAGHSHDGTTGEGQKISLTASITGILPVLNGGTGSDVPATARDNLGLTIGTNVQAYDAGLQSISGLTTAANNLIYTIGSDVYATATLTPFSRTLLDDVDGTTWLTTLGVSAFAKTLLDDVDAPTARTTLGALASADYTAADVLTKIKTVDGSGSGLDADLLGGTTPSAYGLTLLDDATAAAARTTLGLPSDTNILGSVFGNVALTPLGASSDNTLFNVALSEGVNIEAPHAGCTLVVCISGTLISTLGTNTGSDVGCAARLKYYDGAAFQPFGPASYSYHVNSAADAVSSMRTPFTVMATLGVGAQRSDFALPTWHIRPYGNASFVGNTIELQNATLTYFVIAPYV